MNYPGNNTIENCHFECKERGYKYFGVQESTWCHCGNDYGKYGNSTNCTLLCAGNSLEICGGPWANSIYKMTDSDVTPPPGPPTAVPPTPPPTPVPTSSKFVDQYQYMGCFLDPQKTVMHEKVQKEGIMTIEWCLDYCVTQKSYDYFAVEAKSWCLCGSAAEYTKFGPSEYCNMPCDGDSDEICGGDFAMSVYKPSYVLVGCYSDSLEEPDLPVGNTSTSNSAASCHRYCSELGYTYFGLENSTQCNCGNEFGKYGPSDSCNIHCPDSETEICGGDAANSIYQIQQAPKTPAPPTTNVPDTSVPDTSSPETSVPGPDPTPVPHGQPSYIGCFKMDVAGFPLVSNSPKMTVEMCNGLCLDRKYEYFALGTSSACSCGNNVHNQTHALGCGSPCAGNPQQTCGGPSTSSIYTVGSGGGGGDADTSSSVNRVLIILLAVGGAVLVAVIVIAVVMVRRKRNQENNDMLLEAVN
eukprot:TRINITY_DN98_c0_g1_i4.p1 TRINITY_DN98_c0_g1~~TRINITY_DN98_c0_g1_i4.p1  ORF type:complete len:469 (+),score=99.64 TRINITY_DN98_c0_g1_i4:261-1667(+)